MKIHDEHTGCQITLKMDDKETIWKTEQWDCDATQLIQAFAGLMISQTFLPITIWSCMKEEAEDQMRFLKTDELKLKIEDLEMERGFLVETVKKLEAKLREACREEAPLRETMEKMVDAGPYTDHYEEYDTGEGIPDTEPEEASRDFEESTEFQEDPVLPFKRR